MTNKPPHLPGSLHEWASELGSSLGPLPDETACEKPPLWAIKQKEKLLVAQKLPDSPLPSPTDRILADRAASIRDRAMCRFQALAPAKYDRGQAEHGTPSGTVITDPSRDLFADMENEIIDLWFYVQALRERLEGLESEEVLKPRRKNYYMKCRDCGLEHRINFALVPYGRGKAIRFKTFRVAGKKGARLRRSKGSP